MYLAVVGLNQQRAPVTVRGQLAIGADELPVALAGLRGRVREGFVLSTCNRIEAYTVGTSTDAALAASRAFLAERADKLWNVWASRTYEHTDDRALRHLFTVAAGLDSMVLGEPQILGQLRTALDAAGREHLAGAILGQVGAAAIVCGKRVRSETGIGRHATSVVTVALSEVVRRLGGWDGHEVVVVGAGSTAELVLKHLAASSGCRLTLVGRTSERAIALARRYGVAARPFAELRDALASADALIACTAAPHYVVAATDLVVAGRDCSERPLICLDLGVPPDIDPRAATFAAVQLLDLDAVQTIADENRTVREREAPRAQAVVEEELDRFMQWWRVRHVIPTIARVRSGADALREAEVARALARLPGLSPREQRVVRSLASRLVGKLLHAPTATLRERGDRDLAAAMRVLFAVPDPERDAAPAEQTLPPA
ncbi:MAG: glutamyl-tRNA reductase [Gemmatimonadaceae bacterium]